MKCKDTVQAVSAITDDKVSRKNNRFHCDYKNPYCDPRHINIVIGEFRFIYHSKLCNLLPKCSIYRENKTSSYKK